MIMKKIKMPSLAERMKLVVEPSGVFRWQPYWIIRNYLPEHGQGSFSPEEIPICVF
jgi:hypothetical protein